MEYLNLRAQYDSIRSDVDAAIARVLGTQHFILGPEGKQLEEEIAAFCGTKHAVGLNSGTDALELALRALGIGVGDEVITTPFTFIATAEVISLVGAHPVFVDIDAMGNIDPAKIAGAVSRSTRAIIPVHLYGLPADLNAIQSAVADRAPAIPVIEDLAQAIGATYHGKPVGSIGFCGCISFFPAKNLGAYGDAGMVVTDDEAFASRIRSLRNHASAKKYVHEEIGTSSRLDELQAAVLRAKLPHLPRWNEARQRIAGNYSEAFRNLPGILAVPDIPDGRSCVFQQYTLRVERRDALMAHLKGFGIPTAIHYPMPLHLQQAFAFLGHHEGDFPNAERASREVVSLPCYPEMPEADQQAVIEGIRSFYR